MPASSFSRRATFSVTVNGTIDFRREHMRADLWVRDAPRMSGKDRETRLDLGSTGI
jgi:hypothetical protein